MTHCSACPLKRHRRPCPAQWQGCADACVLAVGETRHELVRQSKADPTRAEVEAFRSRLPSVFWERERLADETVTLFVPLSGRDAAWRTHLRPFLDTQVWPRDRVRLVLADTSQSDDFAQKVQRWLAASDYPDRRYYKQVVGERGLNAKPRPNDGGVRVNAALRLIYRRMAAELTTRFVLVVEDDHRPPRDAVEKLLRGFDVRTAAVSALYRGREPMGHWVCWSPRPHEITPTTGPPVPVAGSGFGTLMIRKDWLDGETFEHRNGEPFPYDIGYAHRVARRGGVWKVARDVLSEHSGAPTITPEQRAAARVVDHYLEPPPVPGPDGWLAPLRGSGNRPRPWEGRQARKPWEYKVTAAIVHLDTPELVSAVVDTLRAQSERPYILVVDTGSLSENRAALEAMEADDLETLFLRPRAWRCTSEPVSVAMDCAFARCQTELLYATHVDVFLKRRDFVAWLARQCDARTPAVGYQMSPREKWGNDLWRRILSHTATIFHMPTMRRIGGLWSMTAAFERLGLPAVQPYETGWPDTEVNLGLTLLEHGIGVRWVGDPVPGPNDPPSVLMIGTEENQPYEDENLEHIRSTTSHRLYDEDVARSREQLLAEAIRRAQQRAQEWNRGERGRTVLRQNAALDILVNGCPNRGCKTGCGNAQCRAGRGDQAGGAIASIVHCRQCVGREHARTQLEAALRE